jgi:signal transduction histidine kinase
VVSVIASVDAMSGTSLCKRLTWTVTGVLAAGLTILSLFSLFAIDQTLRTTLDSRLATTERAFVATAKGRALSPAVQRRLLAVLGVQQNGALIADDGAVLMQSAEVPAVLLPTARASGGTAPRFFTATKGTPIRCIAQRLRLDGGRPVVALLWRPLDVVGDYESIAAVTFGLSGFAILAITGLMMNRIMRRGLQPLRSIAMVASEIEARDLSRRVAGSSWDIELEELAATFDRMLDRLESAFRRQRQFTADASHDLRAPLAVIRAEVDLALRGARDREADRDAFVSIREEARSLDALIDALLVAARADGGTVHLQCIDLGDVWMRIAQRVRPFACAHDVTINGIVPREHVLADPEILVSVLLSLLHNAVKFSPPGGTVGIRAESSGRTVHLTIRDEGKGFSHTALNRAFDRFWRDDAARGRGGAGLGLAIAKTAMERMGGSISIANAASEGALVTLSLPTGNVRRSA